MDLIPEHRALLGVDVVGSARNPGYYLAALREAADGMLHTALEACGIQRSEVTDWESTGDGALLTLPSRRLGTLLDVSTRLDQLAAEHNRWCKPDVRLRIAIEVGPVADQPSYNAPKISHSRLLNASTFKKLLDRCMTERSDGSVNTGLIVSEHAFRSAFGGDHTRLVQRGDFAAFHVREKEFADKAWVRVPGFDARSIDEFAKLTATPEAEPTAEQGVRVHNQVGGNMNGVQAGTVSGGITFGAGPR